MMREQFAPLCQTHGVDAVRFEEFDGQVCHHGHHHQRHEHAVAACKFGYEEDACQRCVHDTAHQSAHAQHGKVAFGHLYAQDTVDVPQAGEDEAGNATEEQ